MLETLLSGQLLAAAVVSASLYALVGTGLNLVYGTVRLLNVAHGDFVMLGAYAVFWTQALLGWSPLAGAALASIAGAALGVLVYRGLFAKVLRNSLLAARLESNSLLVFFGLSIVLQNLASLAFSNNYRGYRYLDQVVTIGGASFAANRLVAAAIALAVLALLLFVMARTLLGLGSQAVMQHREAAAVSGVDVRAVYIFSFGAGFGMAALSGGLTSLFQQIHPFMGFEQTVAAFVVVMLGGLGRIHGGLAAAAILGVIETYGLVILGAGYRSLLLYGIFIALLLLRPQGLFRPALR
ncbi:MAG: branched-chain amino acid ABC transporter permease [Lautropia sp.]